MQGRITCRCDYCICTTVVLHQIPQQVCAFAEAPLGNGGRYTLSALEDRLWLHLQPGVRLTTYSLAQASVPLTRHVPRLLLERPGKNSVRPTRP